MHISNDILNNVTFWQVCGKCPTCENGIWTNTVSNNPVEMGVPNKNKDIKINR